MKRHEVMRFAYDLLPNFENFYFLFFSQTFYVSIKKFPHPDRLPGIRRR